MGSHYVCTMVPIIIIPSCSDIAYVSINPPGVTAIVFDYNQPNSISFIYEGFSPPEVVQGLRGFRGDDFTRDSDNDQLYSLLLSGFTFDDGVYVMRSMDRSKCTCNPFLSQVAIFIYSVFLVCVCPLVSSRHLGVWGELASHKRSSTHHPSSQGWASRCLVLCCWLVFWLFTCLFCGC